MAEKKIKKALNWFERFVIRRIVKKFVKKLPDLKNEALEIIATKTPELLELIDEKIKETVISFVEKHKNK